MACSRALAIILFISSIASLVGGIFTYINYQSIERPYEDSCILTTGIVGLFAVTHGILLLKVKDAKSTTVMEAAALFAMATVSAILSPVVITRLLMGLFSSGHVNFTLYTPCFISVTANVVIGAISIYIAMKQSKRVHTSDNDYLVVESAFNKSAISKVMIITALVTFGLSTALFQERFLGFHVVAADMMSTMLFATGVLGVAAHNKKAANLNVWFKTLTTYTAGVSGIATVSIVQLLVHYVNPTQYPKWHRADFTVLTLAHAIFIVNGLITSFIAVVAADDVQAQTPKHNKLPFSATVNIGMLASGLVAAGLGIFNMAIMNYPSYGLPAALISVMVFVAGRHGINIQTVNYNILKYPYYVLNVFNSMGCCWAVGMTIYQFLSHANTQTSLVLLYTSFGYIFAAIGAVSIVPAALFSIKAALQSSKELDSVITDEYLTV